MKISKYMDPAAEPVEQIPAVARLTNAILKAIDENSEGASRKDVVEALNGALRAERLCAARERLVNSKKRTGRDGENLTPREHECAALIDAGMSYAEISQKMGVARGTVCQYAGTVRLRRSRAARHQDGLDKEQTGPAPVPQGNTLRAENVSVSGAPRVVPQGAPKPVTL